MYKTGSVWGQLDVLKHENIKRKCIKKPAVEIQDFTKTPEFMGGDVVALYPNMDQASTAELAFQAVFDS